MVDTRTVDASMVPTATSPAAMAPTSVTPASMVDHVTRRSESGSTVATFLPLLLEFGDPLLGLHRP